MKNLFYSLFIILLVSACSKNKGEEPEPGPGPAEILKVKINPSNDGVNIFEMNIFDVAIEEIGSGWDLAFTGGFELSEHYDSLVWKIPALAGDFKFFEYEPGGMHFTWQWGQNFFVPGAFETHILGYKDNEVIYTDTFTVNISDNKDFLGFNWSDIVASDKHNTGYTDVFQEDYIFATRCEMHESIPAVWFHISNYDWEGADAQENGDMLTGYITKLYSEPVYPENDEELLTKYDELFYFKPENRQPRKIWITLKSVIVLLEDTNPKVDYQKYMIYAEPNRQAPI